MKGCAIRAVLQLLLYVGIVAGFIFLFRRFGFPIHEGWGAALFSALFAWMGLTLFYSARKPIRERKMLARALEGQPPIDGRIGVITGTIHADGGAMRAPLSGSPCVAFHYSISREMGSGRRAHKAVFYEGTALIPSKIATIRGTYRLLAVPTFDFQGEYLERAPTLRRAAEHIRNGEFSAAQAAFTRPAIEKQWSDDDGSYRHEVKHATSDIDLEKCSFTEFVVKDGEAVCVFGRYSAARGGIVPDLNWANETRIMTANGPTILARLEKRFAGYVVWGLICCGASVTIAALFLGRA